MLLPLGIAREQGRMPFIFMTQEMIEQSGEGVMERRSSGNPNWLFGLLLLLATITSYHPAWHGKPLWDDDGHLTRPALRSWHGLAEIWFQPGATQQYYPLVHSAFWAMHRAWGDSTEGYHLTNILLHVCSALLLLKILQKLEIPGSYFAAAIFALHPVQVESVAWISELKNTLSGVFYFSTALVYLGFDRNRKWGCYSFALLLFIAGLLCKTVIATLPTAILVVLWWKRGRLSWKQDALPLVPFFTTGLAAGIFTAWMEWTFIIGSEVTALAFTPVERLLVAGRAVWFYAGKLFWPAELVFIYPRWNVNQSIWWQYLFPVAVALLATLLWILRKRWRGPLAAFLYFTVTLFPALGFINIHPFVYSFVADHFQYLACVGIIVFVPACTALLLEQPGAWQRHAVHALLIAAVILLAGLTWRQCGMYADAETLYRTIIMKNPGCWMAYNDMGNTLLARGKADDAITHYRKALELRPDYAKAENNLGEALEQKGNIEEATTHFKRAIELAPGLAQAHNNLGNVLRNGHREEAIAQYKAAIKAQPNFAMAYNNLGSIYYQTGQMNQAIAGFRKALEYQPDLADAHSNLGNALVQTGRAGEAIAHYQTAIEKQPGDAKARNNLAWVLATASQASIRNGPKALALAQEAERLTGGKDPGILGTLAAAYAECGRFSAAIETAERARHLAGLQSNTPLVKILQMEIELYKSNTPFHETNR